MKFFIVFVLFLAHFAFAQSFDQRADDLVSQMTLDEKLSQLGNVAPAIPRLNIPAYNWWSEALHGIVRPSPQTSTVYPQAIALAATWDEALIKKIASAIADEARANYFLASGAMDEGLTLFAPNMNIFRDPRWGRGQETYGEDPYLTSRLAVQYIEGLQGNDPKYYKTIATAKHFAAYSGPDYWRRWFNATTSDKDLEETYLPQFEAAVREAHVGSVMCSYNSINGAAACSNDVLLKYTLRRQWKFDGYIVSDCGAITNILWGHFQAPSIARAASDALLAGTDLSCGSEYSKLKRAYNMGWIQMEDIDRALHRLMLARLRLGVFDPPNSGPYPQSNFPASLINSPEHQALALQSARESIVLLKNSNSILPLRTNQKIAVLGMNSNDKTVELGNYTGTPPQMVTPLEGIQKIIPDALHTDDPKKYLSIAKQSDITILVLGLNQTMEAETHDRTQIELPSNQAKALKKIEDAGIPVVLVLVNGGPVTIPEDLLRSTQALVESWYDGQSAGTALADVLFGNINPSGKLPVTVYRSTSQLPTICNYDMENNRTYRYFNGPVQFPFGYGISYSTFNYSELRLKTNKIQTGDFANAQVTVTNKSLISGDEIVQLYLSAIKTENESKQPYKSLIAFQRVHFEPQETKSVEFTLNPKNLSLVDDDGSRKIYPGTYEISVGNTALTSTLTLTGNSVLIEF